MEKKTQHDIVCDILALADIVPKQRDIDRIKTALNTRWNDYARTTLEGIQIIGRLHRLPLGLHRIIERFALLRFRAFEQGGDSPACP